VAAQGAGTQPATTFARVETYNSLEILDLKRQAWRRIHQVPGWATELTVSPSNERVAFLSWAEKQSLQGDPQLYSELLVTDTSGKVLPTKIQQVQRYAWCGPTCLVYITGQKEEGYVGFTPDGIGILDLATGQTTRLPAPSTPKAITWAAFDRAVYIKNWPRQGEALIYRLDLGTRTLEPTRLLDYAFSPTGRYYLHQDGFADSLVVRDTRTNAAVNLDEMRREALVLGWASPSEDVLLTVKRPPRRTSAEGRPTVKKPTDHEPEVTYKVYNLTQRRMIRTVKGYLRSWAAPDNKLLVQRGSNYQVIGEP
jgi:hypothetical protein